LPGCINARPPASGWPVLAKSLRRAASRIRMRLERSCSKRCSQIGNAIASIATSELVATCASIGTR
jgi:hypothetical protein